MLAAILKEPGRLVVEERDIPACPAGGLLIRIQACAICSVDARMAAHGQRALVYPRIPGHEVAGLVAESRDASGRFRAGDRVQVFPGIFCGCCPHCLKGANNRCDRIQIMGFSYDGGFAEFCAVPAESVQGGGVNLIPPQTGFEEAALTEPLASCLNGQMAAGVGQGDAVLILGAGPIGLLHAMLANQKGAGKVILAERRAGRLKAPSGIEVDRVIDSSRENLEKVIREETGGQGVDVIFIAGSGIDASGLPGQLNKGGRLCFFSGVGAESARLFWDADLIHYRELSLVGAYGSTSAQNTEALDLIASGRIAVSKLITDRISLSQIDRGLDLVSNCQGLKVVINF